MDTGVLIPIISGIYNELGAGYKENVYHSAVLIELRNHGVQFHSEVICPIQYKGIQIGFERADIVIYDNQQMSSVLELKAQHGSITNKELTQIRKYLKNFNVESGLLINFSNTLEIYSVTINNQVKLI